MSTSDTKASAGHPRLLPALAEPGPSDREAIRFGRRAVDYRQLHGYIRLIGRQSTDLIKSGGFKIGAGEIEGALLEHPGIDDAAVTAEPDPDLGERIVAWIVPGADPPPSEREVADHVAQLLTPHKRPRVVHYLASLPRNDMGKVLKGSLSAPQED